ncbi:hypothetical protein GCK72_016955 [Caenorhabditis remanei]|uniref:Tetratricopeptide SHNi-TPR domain-containing protein n=1 Tax=Caenorhabditis remanei TaxID=31234 RepID=A0A6A5G6W8_CAERE|nr:hypothetical protein GCK72_016955 [Caenorhabditis remanei]KAF1750405.1 hypothetical protein GCK72_016955 [Caenorhabditis remanei]
MTLADTTNTIAQEKEENITKVVTEVVGETKTTVVEKETLAENVVDSTTSEEVKESEKTVEEKEAAPVEESVASVVETVVETITETVTEAVVESTTETRTETTLTETVVVETTVVTSEVVEKEANETAMEGETAEETAPEATKENFDEQLIAGRRFMATNAFDKATEALSRAASMGAELFGEGHEDTFEANFLYGKALLELGKVEDEVLTNALTDIPKATEGDEEVQDDLVENPENVPQEERAEIKHNVEVALGVVSEDTEVIEEEKTGEPTEKTEEAVEKMEGDDKVVEEEQKAEDIEMEAVEGETAEEPVSDETAAAEDQEESDSEDNDDPIKLSWELLETSRCTCVHKLSALESEENVNAEAVKTWKLNHADVLTSLGEHGIADSKYEQAQKDLSEAIAIQAIHLPATSRLLANTTHLLAKAFNMDGLFEKAATHFSDAKNILIAKAEELKKELETASEETKKDLESEIKELEELIPELDALIVDSRASAEQTEKIKESIKQEFETIAANAAKLEGEEAKDISSIVRRPTKRPASEEPAEEDIKKRKSGEGVEEAVVDEKAMETSEATANE